ncbi:beta-N-acetylglucosaminidase domain-containing protein [Deinococcus sp. KSM4-11]|uniref:beta-N-acetylglucosaminidase domain-containing protein n=1 Tax=Deinococcus sp. KSM4-11 TaxID=2568654 RepID=UPI001454DAC2|nr:beta-N-acetylglucosaminidase domain-containing protein [Deinococcus sp. KSM4-11]
MLAKRGVIEGFYGPPWTWAERHDMLDFLAAQGLGAYLYAPKNDPIHRNRWREPYTPGEWQAFGQLAARARGHGTEFIFGLSALGFGYTRPDDLETLRRKMAGARDQGIGSFVLLLDDLPDRFDHSEDAAAFGTLDRAQAWLANTLAADAPGDFSFVPTEYHGAGDSAYLRGLGEHLDPAIGVFWTGHDICSPTLNADDLRAVTAALRRAPLVWDNVPVNDLEMRFDPHLGPLTGRSSDLVAHAAGYFANAGERPEMSKLTLHTVAAFLREPGTYDPEVAAREAALALTATRAEAEALLLLADLARRGPLNPGQGLHHALWPAIDAFWAARGGPPAGVGTDLADRPERRPVTPDEAPLRRAAVELELAGETLIHLSNLNLRRELAPWAHKLAGWARVLKYALAALDHPHDTRARGYVLEELFLVRANMHWVAGDTFDHFARRCVWAAEALATLQTVERA